MDDQVNRKRRTGQLCSKKENLLSRSVGAKNSAERKSPVDEILFVHVVSVGREENAAAAAADYLPSLLSYTAEDKQRDEEILKRFDNGIGFDSNHAIAYCELNEIPKGAETLESCCEPDSKPDEEIKQEEIIELESISTNNPNTKLLSCESITEFVVSTSSKNSAPRHRIKNTIPRDNFERFLSSLNDGYPPMTERDRILFWDYSPELNTNDSLDEPKYAPALNEINVIKLENNNEKTFSSSSNCKLEKSDPHVESERILLTINTSTNKMYKTENFTSSDNLMEDEFNFKINRLNCINDKPPKTAYTNANKQSWNSYESSIFKVPNTPINASKFLTNKIDSNNKEEFYKYLGLETICPNGQHEVIVKINKKRRSLRVQRLQMKEDSKKVCHEGIGGSVEKESPDTNDNEEDIDERSPSSCSETNTSNENDYDRMCRKSEISPPILRRACGSIYSPLCIARSLREENKKTTSIIEKFDYSNGTSATDLKPAQLNECYKSIFVSNLKSRKTRGNRLSSDTPKTSNREIKRFTRLSRKNGFSASEEEHSTDDNELEPIISSTLIPDIPAVFENKIQEFLKESRPKTISCIDRMSYDDSFTEENESFPDLNDDKLEQSASESEKTPINDDQNIFIELTIEKNEPKITSELLIKMEESPPYANHLILENNTKENDLNSADSVASPDTQNVVSPTIETVVEKSPSLTNHSPQKIRKRKTVKRRTVLRSSRINQTILRSKKILKIMTAKLRIKKPKKQLSSNDPTEGVTELKIKSNPAEIMKQDPVDSCELFKIDPTMQQESTVAPAAFPLNKNIEILAQNLLPNPLERTAGHVLHAFYELDFLIVVQQLKISFWKYFKLIKMFAKPQNWQLLGEHERKLNDMEITTPYKNRLCINETNPVYIEMRARQFSEDVARECNMVSVYVNVYYFNEWKAAVVLHSVHLDNICGQFEDIVYTTLTNSRYFIMCWKQETISNVTRTGLCKYSLTPDLNTLASIREFKNMRHMISQLECLSDDKLIGFGETQVTIWDHMTGDVLSNFDFETPIGQNLGSVYYSIEFEDYLLLYQKRHDTTRDPQLIILAVNLSENPHKFRLAYTHDLSSSFSTINSSLSTNDLLITTAKDGSELLLLLQQPHRLFQRKNNEKLNLERFYSSGSQNCVEISEENLIVKSIHEFLMDFVM